VARAVFADPALPNTTVSDVPVYSGYMSIFLLVSALSMSSVLPTLLLSWTLKPFALSAWA
jgi:hypothetical protein